ncbi:MAG TPA: class I SAM-dependent methyltransferase [Solirubrobacteraceae bacterium]
MSTRFVYLHEDRRPRGYEPIYRSFEPSLYVPKLGAHGFLGPAHEGVPESVADIHGKLMPGDQYKLYEAAYFARGAILEVGRLHGKSTAVLALGLRDGANGGHTAWPLYSIELNDKYEPIAEGHLRARGLLDLVTLLRGDSATVIAQLPGRFDTVFIDGDHSYAGFTRDLRALEGRIEPGGVLMFHDCFHPENETGSYGVVRALAERASAMGLAYRGRFGGMALYEHVGETD